MRPSRGRYAGTQDLGSDADLSALLLQSMPEHAAFSLDADGVVASWNRGAEALLGYDEQEILGRHFSVFFNSEDLARRTPDHLLGAGARLGSYVETGWRVRRDGSEFWSSSTILARRGADGRIHGFANVTRDLTEQRALQQALDLARLELHSGVLERTAILENTVAELRAEMEERARVEADLLETQRKNEQLVGTRLRLATIVESSREAIVTVTPGGVITTWNKGAEDLFGYRAAEVVGKWSVLQLPEDRMAESQSLLDRVRAGDHVENFETERLRKGGMRVPISLSLFRIPSEEGNYEIALVARDLTVQREAEAALRRGDERLRAFIGRILTLREEERARISRDMHDIFGQRLTAIKLDVAWLAERPSEERRAMPELATRLEAIRSSVDDMICATRQLATELRPGILDRLGLVATIEWELRQFGLRTGIQPSFDVPVEEVELEQGKATAAYRILQEALTNVARHAEARHLLVSVTGDAGEFTMRIEDDGKGISDAALDDVRSIGILGMHERARIAGGRLSIGRRPGGGTSVSLTYPSAARGAS